MMYIMHKTNPSNIHRDAVTSLPIIYRLIIFVILLLGTLQYSQEPSNVSRCFYNTAVE